MLGHEPPAYHVTFSDFTVKQTVHTSGPWSPGVHLWVFGDGGTFLASCLGAQHSPSFCSGGEAQMVEGCADEALIDPDMGTRLPASEPLPKAWAGCLVATINQQKDGEHSSNRLGQTPHGSSSAHQGPSEALSQTHTIWVK